MNSVSIPYFIRVRNDMQLGPEPTQLRGARPVLTPRLKGAPALAGRICTSVHAQRPLV